MAEKEGGIIAKGHEESMKLLLDVYSEFGLPPGMLPVKNVIEAGFVRSTGYVWLVMKEKVEHTFKMINKVVRYEPETTGYIEKGRMKKIKGVKAKELMIWATMEEIHIEDPSSGKVNFKSRIGITKTFPIEAFALEN